MFFKTPDPQFTFSLRILQPHLTLVTFQCKLENQIIPFNYN